MQIAREVFTYLVKPLWEKSWNHMASECGRLLQSNLKRVSDEMGPPCKDLTDESRGTERLWHEDPRTMERRRERSRRSYERHQERCQLCKGEPIGRDQAAVAVIGWRRAQIEVVTMVDAPTKVVEVNGMAVLYREPAMEGSIAYVDSLSESEETEDTTAAESNGHDGDKLGPIGKYVQSWQLEPRGRTREAD